MNGMDIKSITHVLLQNQNSPAGNGCEENVNVSALCCVGCVKVIIKYFLYLCLTRGMAPWLFECPVSGVSHTDILELYTQLCNLCSPQESLESL